MSNGNGMNGAGIDPAQQPQQQQINPIEAARAALMFLGRVQFTRAERGMFDVSEALLSAIADGRVMLTTTPSASAEPTGAPALPS